MIKFSAVRFFTVAVIKSKFCVKIDVKQKMSAAVSSLIPRFDRCTVINRLTRLTNYEYSII